MLGDVSLVAAAKAYAASVAGQPTSDSGPQAEAHKRAFDQYMAQHSGDDVGTVAAEVAKKTARENPGITRKSATVVSIDATPIGQYITAHVAVDGDDPANTTQAVSEIGTVAVGARVIVSFVPPQGVYLSGVLMNDCEPGEIVYSAFGVVAADVSPPWGPPVESVVTWIETFAGTAGSTDTGIAIAVDGVEQLAYTLGAGVTHMDLYPGDGANFVMFQHSPVTVDISPGTDLQDCTVIIRYCLNRSGRNDTGVSPE